MIQESQEKCPCGIGIAYSACCAPFIEGADNAPTAEKLMRSRYTAFTRAAIDYLMKSHHSSTRPVREKNSIRQWTQSVQWIGLTVINSDAGQANDNTGMVEFKAVYMEEGQLKAIHEQSLFRKEKGMWYYVSGQHY
ncbi:MULTISPECIES: YchJ family protein [unclassified Carboxylicivirga]|uniref:YchJ family protein n=1 Tax=Carboxylicivirga TaxID=1628153 RepID=UPI003D32BA00